MTPPRPPTDKQLSKLLADATPGPWRCSKSKDGMSCLLSGGLWSYFAEICTRMVGDDRDDTEGKANARLIALAPVLAVEVLRLRAALREAGK